MKFCKIALLALVIGLTGCASSAQRQQATLYQSHSTCQSAGFEPGKDGYSQCVLLVYNQAEADRQARSDALAGLGAAILIANRPAPFVPPPTVIIQQQAPVYYPKTVIYPK